MSGTVLLTRPNEDNELLAKQIEEKGYNVICQPFLDVVYHDVDLENLEHYSGLIFTSGNGVRSFCKNTQNRSLPIWVVGDATKDIATKLGFKNVQSAGGGVQELMPLISNNQDSKPLLYGRGEHISYDLSGHNIEEKILYHTEIKEKISDSVLAMIEKGDFTHILFFSKRTAQAFVKIVENSGNSQNLKHTKALCLGASMIESLSVLPWKSIEVADQPNRNSIMALLD